MKLNLAAHKLRELLRDSDSRSLSSYFVSATQRDEWDLSRQTDSIEIWKVKNSNSFF